MSIVKPRELISALFKVAVDTADPARVIPNWLPEKPRGKTIVIGAGKASAAMAFAFESAWKHEIEGLVITGYGYGAPCKHIKVLEASHPVPNEAGLSGTQKLIQTVSQLTKDDLVVALISGGGSALLPAPPPGLTLADEQALNRALLHSGLPISDMNLIRKHVSQVKGGRLARMVRPAKLITLVLSDVPGDDPAEVASGPTVPSIGTRADAIALIEQTRVVLPPAILTHLRFSAADTPVKGDPDFADQEVYVIGSARLSLRAAAESCRNAFKIPAAILSDSIEGEARDIGRMHAALSRQIAIHGQPLAAPVMLLSGGETTVTVAGPCGRGGRNTEFALSLAIDLHGTVGINALAADTDGVDGASGGAGAFVDRHTIHKLRNAGLDPKEMLEGHDSGSAFASIDSLFITGPTHTNVNDFRAILIGKN